MGLTKAVAAVDAWAEVTQPSVREGTIVDTSGMYEAVLHIDACLSEAVAETAGATIYVEVSSNTSGDSDWSVLTSFGGPTGTAFKTDLAGDEAAGQTVLSVNNPDTANLDHPSKFLFIEHTGTPANSEIVFQVSNEGDAGDTITILDGLTNNQTSADSDIWEIDSATASCVAQYVVAIPMGVSRVRVIYDNTHSTAADIYTRARISSVTAV